MRIKFETTGGQEYVKALDIVTKHISDFTPAWKEITKDLEKHEARTFSAKGGVDGMSQWAPRAKQYRHPILNKTGALKASLSSPNGRGAIREMYPKFMVFGVDVFEINYAAYHQYGTRNMPARPVLRISSQLATKILKRIQAYVAKFGLVRGGGPIA